MSITLGKYDLEMDLLARRPWTHFKINHRSGVRHLVWGRISILIEDWTREDYARICSQCDSDEIGEVSSGDEGCTVCEACGAVEQGYRYLNKREYEAIA